MTAPIDTSTEAVEALLNDVTPGPWVCKILPSYDPQVDSTAGTICDVGGYLDPNIANDQCDANSRFIAAARELVPALRAALTAAEAENARLREVLKQIEGALPTGTISLGPNHVIWRDAFRDIQRIARAALTKGGA